MGFENVNAPVLENTECVYKFAENTNDNDSNWNNSRTNGTSADYMESNFITKANLTMLGIQSI